MLILDCADIREILRIAGHRSFLRGLAEWIRDDFARWEEFDKTPRLATHSPHGVLELMPACDGKLYSFKFVNGHPANPGRGRLTVAAIGCIADVETGYTLLLSEMTLLTALRTAATSALAASLLARPDSHTMALIGAGAQAEFQCLAFNAIAGVSQVRCFDPDPAAMEKLSRNMRGISGVHVERCGSLEEALQRADIITTATAVKRRQTLLSKHNVRAGTHINAIGGDCPGKTELAPDLLRSARVFVEYEPQTRIEGEIQNVDHTFEVHELWKVITGVVEGRTERSQITVFDSVGFSLEDFSTLRYVRELAQRLGIGHKLSLIPAVRDPKDLFAALT